MADLAWPRFASAPAATRSEAGRDEAAEQRDAAAGDGRVGRCLGARRGCLDGGRRTGHASGGTVAEVREVAAARGRPLRVRSEPSATGSAPGRITCTTKATALARAFLAGAFAAGAATAVAASGDRGENWEQGATHAVSLDGTPDTPARHEPFAVEPSGAKRKESE